MSGNAIDLSGKTAIVMGASQGIGLASAKELALGGASVVLAARSAKKIETGATDIRSNGGKAESLVCDVTDFEQVAAAIKFARDRFGGVDILVNNAGTIDPLTHLHQSDPEAWAHAADVNLKGVYHGMRAALPIMVEQGHGTIVNMSSGAANSSLVGWSHYCATKAAAKKLTEVAHMEVGHHGVHVIGLSPGTVATDMMAKIRDAKINAVSNLDWDKHISPGWVGRAVAYLCGPEGGKHAGSDFSIKTAEGRMAVGLNPENAPD